MKLLKITTIIIIGLLVINGCSKIKFIPSERVLIPKTAIFKQKNVALVLGGGGAKGFAHVGVIEELEQAGIVPDVIIGCSAGSIIGALYAADPNIENLKSTVLSGKKSEVIAVSISDWPYSVYSKAKLKQYLLNNLKVRNFEQLKIPFIATATNFQYGNLTAFSKGDLIQPVVASAAFPGAFAPVKIENQYFVDCGVADPVPVRFAKSLGFKTIIAVNIAEQLPTSSPNHIFGVLKRSLEISYINQSQYSVEDADIVIDFNFKDIGTFTDQYNYYLYEEGKKSAKRAISKILKLLQKQQ